MGQVRKYILKRHKVIQPVGKSYRLIPLTQGQNAIVDLEDYDWLSQWNWCADWSSYTKSFYAMRKEGKKYVGMAGAILGCGTGELADHRNHDTLDNRKRNIRKANYVQNAQNGRRRANNTSGFKGVHFSLGKWQAHIGLNGARKSLGYFHSAEAAAAAYKKASEYYFGAFAERTVGLK